MGEEKVSIAKEETMGLFMRNLLRDVQAMEYMLAENWFETDTIRIGAEQEMCLVDKKTWKPSCINMRVLKRLADYDWATTEIAKFNLETNLSPQVFTGKAISELEKENLEQVRIVREAAKRSGANIVLTGILPTLRKFDLAKENLTPKPRYHALIDAISAHATADSFELRLQGIDEILLKHDSPLLEACNTSYQVHLQVTPQTFVPLYNISQTLAGPIIALSANSPLVFGKRLWHESRIALFQQALDVRTSSHHLRERLPRVNFGSGWLENSILDIYREDISRFRVLLGTELEEESLKQLKKGKAPKLKALQVHNGTVYRWNRPCYGISGNGKPHLRIENRVIPAGPTILDQTANAAFWLGAMIGLGTQYRDVRERIGWADVQDNFHKAARYGIDSKFTWFNDQKVGALDLIQQELLPIARHGLETQKIDSGDIDRYLGVIEERVKRQCSGARWMLRSYTALRKEVNQDEAVSILTERIHHHQTSEKPVHLWPLAAKGDMKTYRPIGLRVEEFMSTDLMTVHENDLLELVVDMMDWRKLRYLPVEDKKGQLVGLVTTRKLLRYFTRHGRQELPGNKELLYVRDIMIENPYQISPDTTIKEAMYIMREKKIGCLPVTQDGELLGVITEMDFLQVAATLIERLA
ncbi:MAG: CBS domain-containing protein [Bacteroidota bacterium]